LNNFSATISTVIAFMDWKITPLNNLSVIIITNVYPSTNDKFVIKSIKISDQGLSGMGNSFNNLRHFSLYIATALHVL
jgi:hypothetical protein